MAAGQNKNPEASASGFFNRVFSRLSARIDQHSEPGEEQQEHSQVESAGDFGSPLEFFPDQYSPERSGIPGASARRSMPGSWTLRPIANAPAKASSMSWRSCCPAGTSAWKSSRPCCRAVRNAVSGSLSGSSLRRLATPGRVRCAGVGCRWLPAKIKIPKHRLRDFSIGYSAV